MSLQCYKINFIALETEVFKGVVKMKMSSKIAFASYSQKQMIAYLEISDFIYSYL